MTHNIILFASGKGSNVAAILDYFKNRKDVNFSLIVSNKKDAGVLSIAENNNIKKIVVKREEFQSIDFLETLKSYQPSLLILAGFLWKIPETLVQAFPNQIINIHPSLLPEFGGKGMYGHFVHEAVIQAKRKESGITIHYVNEIYDNGAIIVQARCSILEYYTPNDLANSIHKLEHYFFPRTIEYLLNQFNSVN